MLTLEKEELFYHHCKDGRIKQINGNPEESDNIMTDTHLLNTIVYQKRLAISGYSHKGEIIYGSEALDAINHINYKNEGIRRGFKERGLM